MFKFHVIAISCVLVIIGWLGSIATEAVAQKPGDSDVGQSASESFQFKHGENLWQVMITYSTIPNSHEVRSDLIIVVKQKAFSKVSGRVSAKKVQATLGEETRIAAHRGVIIVAYDAKSYEVIDAVLEKDFDESDSDATLMEQFPKFLREHGVEL